MKLKLRGVNTIRKRDGRVYYYHRASGRRLEGPPNSPQFMASYAAAEQAKIKTGETLGALIDQFMESPLWRGYSDKTKREWVYVLRAITMEYGTVPIKALEDKAFRVDVIKWRDRHAKAAPAAASTRFRVLSLVLAWASDLGAIGTNILASTRSIYNVDRSEQIWLPEHIAAFSEHANEALRQCLTLALYTGQRQGDLIKLTWSAYDGRFLSVKQGKTGARVTIPCVKPLKAMLDAMPRSAAVILTSASGRPWTATNIQHRWLRVMKKAGIEGLHFHDLRGTAITMLSEAGCTHQEIAAITGHSLKSVATILDKYLARTRELAENAITKLDLKLERNENKSCKPHLQTRTLSREKRR